MNNKEDRWFLDLCNTVSERSSCSRRQVGAVIAKNGHLLSTGYNGTAKGLLNCDQGGCPLADSKRKFLEKWRERLGIEINDAPDIHPHLMDKIGPIEISWLDEDQKENRSII
jgi:deoxycytidylate deaminase